MTNTQNPMTVGSSHTGKPNPAMTGPNNDKTQINFKEIAFVLGAVVFIGGLIAGTWFYTQQDAGGAITFSKDDKRSALASNSNSPVTSPGKPVPVAVTLSPVAITKQTSPFPTTDAVHADIYFDFDRSRLRADAVAILQEKAEILKKEGNWAVLVQGYADQHGPTEYNKGLALRRAQAVKQFLVELGVPQVVIKVVTIGKEGMICDDQSKECQRLNRRVHLEIMKVGSPFASLTPALPAVVKHENESSSAVDASDNEADDLLNPESENATQTR